MLDFRPHHMLVALGFDEEGPSQAFLDNCRAIRAHLEGPRGQSVRLRVTSGIDALCMDCPGRHGRMCEHDGLLSELDAIHKEILSLFEDEILTWGEARRRLLSHIGDERFDHIAARCPWKEFGAARRAIDRLRTEARQMTTGIVRRPDFRR